MKRKAENTVYVGYSDAMQSHGNSSNNVTSKSECYRTLYWT